MTDITPKQTFKPNERLVTIVLKHLHNARNSDGGRLVHTYFFAELLNGNFEANHDDRTSHRPEDSGVTWAPNHIAFDSPEAQRLLKAAQKAD